MSYQVFGASVSPFVRKVLVFLAEKGIAFDHDPVNPFSPPKNYRDTSPLGKIPALKDGDKTLADSSVICSYLERRHPEPALYPSDDYAYARALWFEEFMDGGFTPKAGGGFFFPLGIAPLMLYQPGTPEIRADGVRGVRGGSAARWGCVE
jgi:glutathione S-transferase